MRKPVVLAVSALWAGARLPSSAQTYDVAKLTNDLKQHPLVLRNLSGASVVYARWTGSEFGLDHSPLHSLLPVQVQTISASGTQLRIVGRRMAQLPDGHGGWSPGDPLTDIQIVVESFMAPTDAELGSLQNGLFFPDWKAALAAVPAWLGGEVPTTGLVYSRALGDKIDRCDCSASGTAACAGKRPGDGLTQPRVQHQEAPKFSQQANGKKFAGSVRFAFIVDAKGRVQDPWLVRPQGSGLDENAYEALMKYRFQPALCHNVAIAVPLQVEINWRTF